MSRWPRRRLSGQAGLVLAFLACLTVLAPAVAGNAEPVPVARAVHAGSGPASASPVRIDLYRAGGLVSQTNLVQCAGASM